MKKILTNKFLTLLIVFSLSFSTFSCASSYTLPSQDVCSYWQYISALLSIYCADDKKLSRSNIDTMKIKMKMLELENLLREDPAIDELARKLYNNSK